MLPGEEFTFGKRNRPQTPVTDILANFFGEQAGSEMQLRYNTLKEIVRLSQFKWFVFSKSINLMLFPTFV